MSINLVDLAEQQCNDPVFVAQMQQNGKLNGNKYVYRKNQGFDIVWARDIETDLSDDYIIKGVFGGGAMSVVYGESNSGKTFFVIDLAMHVATGKPWRDRKVKRGIVMYVASEGPKGVEKRVKAYIDSVKPIDAPKLLVVRDSVNLLSKEGDTARIIELCREIEEKYEEPVSMVVFDTLARSMAGGNENSFEDMSAVVGHGDAIRNTTGAHVLFVHHSGKDAAKGARGHSSLRAATDSEIEVFASKHNGVKSHTASVTKQRDYENGDEFFFTLKQLLIGYDDDGDKVTTCIVEIDETGVTKKRKTRKLTQKQNIALEALEIAQKREKSDDFVSMQVWRDDFYSRHLTLTDKEANRFQWRDARNALLEAGLVIYDDDKSAAKLA